MDKEWYEQVLNACALNDDLKQFPAHDETDIGERGITISGGQKQDTFFPIQTTSVVPPVQLCRFRLIGG